MLAAHPLTSRALTSDAVTIVIPTLGRRPSLRAAIASAIDQRPAPSHVLVVDDSADQAARPVVRTFGDDRIRWVPNARSRGPSGARNSGLEHATTQLTAFLDDDDRFEPGFVERSLAAWNRSPADTIAIWTGIVEVFEDGRELRRPVWTPSGTTQVERFAAAVRDQRFGSGHGFSVDRRGFLDAGGFDEALRAAEDIEALFRILLAGSVATVDECLVRVHRFGDDRLSEDPRAYAEAFDAIARRHAALLEVLPGASHALGRSRMRWHLLAGHRREGSTIARSLMRYGPAAMRAKAAAMYALLVVGFDPRRAGARQGR